MNSTQKTLVKMGSRERSLLYAYALSTGDQKSLKKDFGFDCSVIVTGEGKEGKITPWYNPDELIHITAMVVEKVKVDPSFYEQVKTDFYARWTLLLSYIKKEKEISSFKEAYDFYEIYQQWWSSLSYTLDACKASEDIKSEYQIWRIENEKYTEDIDRLLIEFTCQKYPQYTELADIISPKELLMLDTGPFDDNHLGRIEARADGFVLYREKVFPISDLNSLLQRENIILETEEPDTVYDSLNGVAASLGYAKGKARVVRYKKELVELQEGEILIAEATTPEYVPAIKKALAVVTDEGSIMSHAAITCREFGKVCIVGTAWATKIFKTGEIVEVIVEKDKATVRRIL